MNHVAQFSHFIEKPEPKATKWPTGHFEWRVGGNKKIKIHALK